MTRVSLIVPVFNSRALVCDLYQRISDFVSTSDLDVEIVFVDDASTDGSLAMLREIEDSAQNVTVAVHPVNLGQAAALLTGIGIARNDIVVTLDDDLKHQPQDIPRLLARLMTAGANDLVIGVYKSRGGPLWRKLAGICSNAISNLFLLKPLPLRLTTFCAFRRHLCVHFEPSRGHDRALITELVQAADRTVTIPIQSHLGKLRRSRYNFASLWRLFMKRSRYYQLSRVLGWFGCCLLVGIGTGSAATTQNALLSEIAIVVCAASVIAASLLIVLAIIMRRCSHQTERVARRSP